MAFTFQINNSVKFNHDEQLLSKAVQLTPQLTKREVTPSYLVKLVKDKTKLGGVGVKAIDKIENLSNYQLKRNDQLIIDFGAHYVGQFSIDIQKIGSPQDAPLAIRLKFAEIPVELATKAADYDGWLSKSWIQEEVVHLDQLPSKLTLPRRYAFRYVEISVIDTSPKWAAVFSNPQLIAVSSANDNKIKRPKLNDSELQKIYDTSVNTLRDCMQEVFEDGPKRDRRLWLGDLRLQALANYATYNNTDLVKRCLYLFAGTTAQDGRIVANVFTNGEVQPDDTFLFDYSLFFVSTLFDFYRHTNDQEALTDLYPIAKRQIELALDHVRHGRYIDDEDYPVFIDWSNEFDKTTAGQAVMIYVLKQFLVLAGDMHDNDVANIKQVLAEMINYAHEQLFDEQRQLFASGEQREFNIASQIWMVLAKVVTGTEAKQLMEATIQQLFPVKDIATPYMYHHITEALFVAGLKDEAIQLMKDYWGKMIELGADTYWESFEPEKPGYTPYGSTIVTSYCHAWGCTPAYLIKKYLM